MHIHLFGIPWDEIAAASFLTYAYGIPALRTWWRSRGDS